MKSMTITDASPPSTARRDTMRAPLAVTAPSGEHARFQAAYAQHRDAVWRYFVRRLGDVDVADDLTSEVFVVAWRRRGDAPVTSLPWLYGVARKVLAGDRRAARRRAALDARLAEHLVPEVIAPADAAGQAALVAEALAELSVEERELLVLAAWEGLSATELAVTLDCRPSTARVRLHRARRRLAYHLAHLGHEGTPS